MKRALQIILAVSVFGAIFSGVLTYGELFGDQAMSCPSPGAPGTVWGFPACVYGFFMYLAIAVTAGLGLFGARLTRRRRPTAGHHGHVSAA